jgi:hypothetical protein
MLTVHFIWQRHIRDCVTHSPLPCSDEAENPFYLLPELIEAGLTKKSVKAFTLMRTGATTHPLGVIVILKLW